MSRIYSSTNRIKFTDIPEKYAVPRAFRGKQSEVHSSIVVYVVDHFKNTKRYRQTIVDALNCLTYCVIQNDPPPYDWDSVNPLETMPEMPMDVVEEGLGDLFLTEDAVEWDVQPTDNVPTDPVKVSKKKVVQATESKLKPNQQPEFNSVADKMYHDLKAKEQKKQQQHIQKAGSSNSILPTPKEDLYIQPPKYPRFDVRQIWMQASIGGDKLVIYKTLPSIPTKQNEISITTDLNSMTDAELMALYPNRIIHTRSPKLYERYEGLDYDEDLGCIIPIGKFTREQVVDNIICYPHLYKLKKINDEGRIVNFYTTIEINGELIPIAEIWDELPESKIIPRQSEFVKEYVIRRYLLEEQIGMEHKYKMFGTLDPYLTLFMPFANYAERGYKDSIGIVKKCVMSRIRYKQSRNPIMRRLEVNV